jgi:ankyrin repeat protein
MQDKFQTYLTLAMQRDVQGFRKAINGDENLLSYRHKGKNLVEIVSKLRDSALLMAALYQHPCGVKLFNQANIQVQSITDPRTKLVQLSFTSDPSPFLQAVKTKDIRLIKKLVTSEAVQSADSQGFTPLHYVALGMPTSNEDNFPLKDYSEAIEILLAHGANINVLTSEGVSPVMAAAFVGNTEAMKALLRKKANIYLQNPDGINALAFAIFDDYGSIIALLIEQHRKNLEARTTESEIKLGSTSGMISLEEYLGLGYNKALEMAFEEKNLDKAIKIFQNAAEINPNVLIKNQTTLLMWAAHCGNYLHTRTIAENKAVKIGIADHNKNTALHYAVLIKDNKEIVKLLLALGAKNIPNAQGATPLDIAKVGGHKKIVKTIKKVLEERQRAMQAQTPVVLNEEKLFAKEPVPLDSKLAQEIVTQASSCEKELTSLQTTLPQIFADLLTNLSKSTHNMGEVLHKILETRNMVSAELTKKEQQFKTINLNPTTFSEQVSVLGQLEKLKEELISLEDNIKSQTVLCQKYIDHPDKLKTHPVPPAVEPSNLPKKLKEKKTRNPFGPQPDPILPKDSDTPSRLRSKTPIKTLETKKKLFSQATRASYWNQASACKRTLSYALQLITMFDQSPYLIRNNPKVNPLSTTTIRYLQEAIIFAITQDLRFRWEEGDRRFAYFNRLRHNMISKRGGTLDSLNDQDFADLYAEFCSYIRQLHQNIEITPPLDTEGILICLMNETQGDLPSTEEINILDIAQIIAEDLSNLTDTQAEARHLKLLLQDYVQKITNTKVKTVKRDSLSPEMKHNKKIGDDKRHNKNYLENFFAELSVNSFPNSVETLSITTHSSSSSSSSSSNSSSSSSFYNT